MTTATMTTPAKTKTKKSKNADRLATLIGKTDRAIDVQARDRLVTARVALLIRHSFFGNLATRLKLINADDWLATAATDGVNFYYNSRFIMLLKIKEVEFLVGHEILHLVYDHLGRRDIRDPKIWNIAADYCVNADLKRHRIGDFITSVPCLYDIKYENKCAEEVYADLMKNATYIDIDDLIDQMIDHHLDETDEEDDGEVKGNRPGRRSQEERDQLRQEMKQNIINAANNAKEAGHGIPESVARMIQELTEPKMPWRELIQTMLTSTIKTDYSFMRPSRRGWHLDAVLPSQNPGEEVEITVAIDTSGSITNTDLALFLSEIQGIMDSFTGYKIKVLSWDTKVSGEREFTSENLDDIATYVPEGGGGTDPNCIFDHLKQTDTVPSRLVVFTDGYFFAGHGDADLCDTTWIIFGNPSFVPHFGTWAHFTD